MFKKWINENKKMTQGVPKRAVVLFSSECAQKALPLYERWFSNDYRPRQAIEAGYEYGLTGKPIPEKIIRDAREAYHFAAEAIDRGSQNYKMFLDATRAAEAASTVHDSRRNVDWTASNALYGDRNYDAFVNLKRRMIGNNVKFVNEWKTYNAIAVSKQIWSTRTVGNLPILADILMDSGIDESLVDYMKNQNEQTLADWFLWNINLS